MVHLWSSWKWEERIAGLSLLVSAIALAVSGAFSYINWRQTDRSLKQSEESLRISKETVENEYRKAPSLTISLGRDLFLNAKPYVGAMISIYNSGAQPGVVSHGTLQFGGHQLSLVMMSPQAESWTYGSRRDEIPMRFSYFAPITVPKSASVSSVIWFERDMGTTRLFTAGRHSLEMKLFNDTDEEPVASKTFQIGLTDANVTFIYRSGNETTQLPVTVDFYRRSPS